jgi:hypothetical protein
VTFTLHITDDLAGVDFISLEFRHEFGFNALRYCQVYPDPPLTDAVLTCRIDFPRYSAEGLWMPVWVSLRDGVGNITASGVVDCIESAPDGRCIHYEYNEFATPLIRSMEIQNSSGELDEDQPFYLPLIAAP